MSDAKLTGVLRSVNDLGDHPACRDRVARAKTRPACAKAHADPLAPFTEEDWHGCPGYARIPDAHDAQETDHMQEDAELQGACHCGAVRLTLPSRPQKATRCNCSLCRRVGAVWAYYEFGTVAIQGHPENTDSYVQGDRTLRTVRCRTCGITTHWEPLMPDSNNRHGVNLNNFDPALVAQVEVRRFDGADTWTFLDEGAA